jgi:hypothetical protein
VMTNSVTKRARKLALALSLAVAMALVATPALADDYDNQRSAHPLRIAAYIVHPIGLLIDTLIFRPAHWIGSHVPFKTIFGHTD